MENTPLEEEDNIPPSDEMEFLNLDDCALDDFEIVQRLRKYNHKQQEQSNWKNRTGPVYGRGVQVVLYRDFDANPKTKKMPFDWQTDGKIYEIVNVHENGMVDLKELGSENIHHHIDGSRIRIYKNANK
ncbi:hypothetical protein ENBRE01_3315 [Enteropsectra breve]|nr:hypothetical protein ENBRE01_3315 [Enteropsectra breve]